MFFYSWKEKQVYSQKGSTLYPHLLHIANNIGDMLILFESRHKLNNQPVTSNFIVSNKNSEHAVRMFKIEN